MLRAKEKEIEIRDTVLRYIDTVKGDQVLVIILGLSEGLRSVKGQAFTLGLYCRKLAKARRVLLFGRPDEMQDGYSTRDMAHDVVYALRSIGVDKADFLGISQGGMIAQYIAIDTPDMINKLILAVTASRPSETLIDVVGGWIDMAERGDYARLIEDSMAKTYTEKHIKRYQLFMPVIKRIGKPKSFDRFIVQAHAVLNHDAYDELHRITCPTLIIGGDDDKVTGERALEDMADRIPHATLVLYEGFGHGAYEECKEYNQDVQQFLTG